MTQTGSFANKILDIVTRKNAKYLKNAVTKYSLKNLQVHARNRNERETEDKRLETRTRKPIAWWQPRLNFFYLCRNGNEKIKLEPVFAFPQKKIPNQLFDAVIKTLLFFSSATHSEKALLQKFIEPTLELVEEAWHGEVTSTKRNRGWYDRSMDWQAVCVCATLDNF